MTQPELDIAIARLQVYLRERDNGSEQTRGEILVGNPPGNAYNAFLCKLAGSLCPELQTISQRA